MITIDDVINNFVDYIDHAYRGQLYYEMTNRFDPFCGPHRRPDSETVGVSMTISASSDDVMYDDPYNSLLIRYATATHRQYFEVVVIFENGWSTKEIKFTINGSDRLTEFLSVFACFMCLNSKQYLYSYELFELIPDKVDLSHIIRVIEIDHNVELLRRMIEDIYHYCNLTEKDGSYKRHIGVLLDHFTSTEHNDPELTAVILNKMHELDITDVDEAACFYI